MGYFITFEGPDGSGKSTIMDLVFNHYLKAGMDVISTREPGGTPISEEIRNMILSKDNAEMSARTEALLYAASRAQHVDELINPSLEAGKLVLCDRFMISSLAYQGYGRGLGVDTVRDINLFAIGDRQPDLILFFNVDPITTLKRKRVAFSADRLESEHDSFHQKVYDGYMEIMKSLNNSDRLEVIDATKSIEEVLQQVLKIIDNFLGGKQR